MYQTNIRKFRLLLGVVLLLLLTGVAYADDRPNPVHSDPEWQASYWNNMTLSGAPTITRGEADINWDWGTGSPQGGIQADHFSARWQRYFDTSAGTYRFTATSDDGIRIYVDNRLILNQWNDHARQTFTADVNLTAGHHQVVIEYYENAVHAVAQVSFAPAPVSINKWRGEYFNNRWLSGSPVLVQNDNVIDFNWGHGSPAGLASDNFSVRWTRTLNFQAGSYRFTTATDDGVRLWVNGHLLIDQWQQQAVTTHANSIHISGDVPIKMEYYEQTGLASARLSWVRGVDDPPPPSTGSVIVDDRDVGFAHGGSSRAWRTAWEGYNDHMRWTWNNDKRRSNYNWARWYANLAAYRYEVFVYIPQGQSTTSNARYWVSHQRGYTLRTVDQSANGGRWVSLGTYMFRGDSSRDYVSLSDITYEPYTSRLIAFDAVKWEPR